MTRHLLDTDIISNLVRLEPSESLLAWMEEQHDENLLIASLTLAEIRRGIPENHAVGGVTPLTFGSPVPKGRRHCSEAVSCHSTTRPGSSGRS